MDIRLAAAALCFRGQVIPNENRINMEKKNTENLFVTHGSEWPEHEDFLIGNKEGLKALIAVTNEAIENGESKTDLYGYVGVRCLNNEFFEQKETDTYLKDKIIIWSIILPIGFVLITGVITIFSWF